MIAQFLRILREWREDWRAYWSPHIPISAARRQQLRRTYLED
jgi:hypothetical protein